MTKRLIAGKWRREVRLPDDAEKWFEEVESLCATSDVSTVEGAMKLLDDLSEKVVQALFISDVIEETAAAFMEAVTETLERSPVEVKWSHEMLSDIMASFLQPPTNTKDLAMFRLGVSGPNPKNKDADKIEHEVIDKPMPTTFTGEVADVLIEEFLMEEN